jgi:hypothetical protein
MGSPTQSPSFRRFIDPKLEFLVSRLNRSLKALLLVMLDVDAART